MVFENPYRVTFHSEDDKHKKRFDSLLRITAAAVQLAKTQNTNCISVLKVPITMLFSRFLK